MASRRRERVEVGKDENGKQMFCWATGKNAKELHDSIVRIYIENSLIEGLTQEKKANCGEDPERVAGIYGYDL